MALQNYVTIHARLVYADLLVDRQYGRGGHLGHVTCTIYTNLRSRLLIKFGFDLPSGFRGEDV